MVQLGGATVGDELMRHLVSAEENVTYRRAHDVLFGPVPRWLHAHTQRVITAAMGTSPVDVGGLRVRLDALIVDAKTRRPGARHFLAKDYSEKDWLSRFAARSLCEHLPRDIRDRSRRRDSAA